MEKSRKKDNTLFFLLDELMPPRKRLLSLNKLSNLNIRHLAHDYQQASITDLEVARLAQREGRIIVTMDEHFNKKRRLQKNNAIVKMQSGLTVEEVEVYFKRMVKKFSKVTDYMGRIILLSKDKMRISDHNGKSWIVNL